MNLPKFFFRNSKLYTVSLAGIDKIKKDCLIVKIPVYQLWKNDTLKNKFRALLKFKYKPSETLIQTTSKTVFKEEFFGQEMDLGNAIFDLMIWHHNRDWNLNSLHKSDVEKAEALEAMTNLSRKRHWTYTSPNLHLNLVIKQSFISSLIYPVVAKTPIRSIQYFVDIHSRYTFNAIRLSNHNYANEIVSYLYELLLLNQKTANKLHSIIGLIVKTKNEKKDSIMLLSEIDAISDFDLTITYLKASIEKVTYLTAYIFNIPNLETKKEHKKRINTLNLKIPETVKKLSYFDFFIENIGTKKIEKLNNFRTGILHKKGISSNQPQEFYNNKKSSTTQTDLFNFLMDQHCVNSAILISSLTLLTDELVKINKPEFKFSDLPIESLLNNLKIINASNSQFIKYGAH